MVGRWLLGLSKLAVIFLISGGAIAGSPGEEMPWQGSWRIKGLAPSAQTQSIWADSGFTITFEAETVTDERVQGRVAGRACNNFFGNFEVAAGKARIEALGATRMACAGVTGHMESELFQLLSGEEAGYLWDGDVLRLDYGEERHIVLQSSMP